MTLNKTFSSNNMEPLETDFAKGCKFIRDRIKWTVTGSFVADNAEMRRVVGDNGTEEITTLHTLVKDFEAGDITFLAIVDDVGIALSKRENEQARIKKEEDEKREEEDERGIQIDLDSDGQEHKFHKKF